MNPDLVEGLIWLSSFTLVATLGMGVVALAFGRSNLAHPQATRYLTVVFASPFLLGPAWWIIFAGAWQQAYAQLGYWWDIPVFGWITVIGFWCSVAAPATIILTLIAIRCKPAQGRRYREQF